MSKSIKSVKVSQETVLKQSVGMDVSKDSVYVCFAQQQIGKPFRIISTRKFELKKGDLKELKKWIEQHRKADVPLFLQMEATGVYYENLAYFLHEQGYRVAVSLPNETTAYGRSLPNKSKTDKIDSKMLAQYAIERETFQWIPLSANLLVLKRFCRERLDLMDLKTVVSNQLHAKDYSHCPNKESVKRGEKIIKLLNEQIEEVDKNIESTVKEDKELKERLDNVCTIHGVGLITAATVIAETNGFALFTSKSQVVSYAGYDVVRCQSGESIDKPGKISKKGNGHIRRALYFPALCAKKKEGVFKNLYDRVFDKTKIKMKGYVAVQRKLLVMIYTLYKNNCPFDPNYNKIENKSRQEQEVPAYAA